MELQRRSYLPALRAIPEKLTVISKSRCVACLSGENVKKGTAVAVPATNKGRQVGGVPI
jgi:hypothetical protein